MRGRSVPILLLGFLVFLGACGSSGGTATNGSGPAPVLRIVWSEGDSNCTTYRIRLLTLDGTPPETVINLPGPDSPGGLTFDPTDSRLYFTRGGNNGNPTDSIEAVDLDGSNHDILYTTATATPRGIACLPSQGRIFWVETATPRLIRRANMDGSTVTTVRTFGGTSNPGPIAIDVPNSKLYSADVQFEPHIERVDLDGTNVELIYSRPPATSGGVSALDLDPAAGALFWLERTASSIGTDVLVRRADLDGSNVETILLLPGNQSATPRGIAVDPVEKRIYWTESDFCGVNPPTGRLRSVRYDGVDLRTELDGLGVLLDLIVTR